jgi:hypothetical protein
MASPPLLPTTAQGPDAICFVALLMACFIPMQQLLKTFEDGEGWEWSYQRFPVWLLAGYCCLVVAYGQCLLLGLGVSSTAHALLSFAAYACAAKHVLHAAGGPPGGQLTLLTLVASLGAAAGVRLAGGAPPRGCGGIFGACALGLGLCVARLARKWAELPAYDLGEKAARRRALRTLVACALVAGSQPFSGTCGSPGPRSSDVQAAQVSPNGDRGLRPL